MCGFVKKIFKAVGSALGVAGGGGTPEVIREAPIADAAAADAAAASLAIQNRNRRRRSGLSLLATMGGSRGDTSNVITGQASAAPGKTLLGS